MKYFFKSFVYAVNGIWSGVADQLNLKIQIGVALMVVGAGFYFRIAPLEWCLILLCIGLVLGLVGRDINTGFPRLTFGVNTSPLAGRDGQYVTSRQVKERLVEGRIRTSNAEEQQRQLEVGGAASTRTTVDLESGTRTLRKKDLVHNNLQPRMEVDPQTYTVRADGVLLTCEPMAELPLAQRYFLF